MQPTRAWGVSSDSLTGQVRRAQIVDAAIAVLAETGFAAASLAAVADRVGISKGVISYHFAGKDDLLSEVVRTVLRRATEWMTPRIESAESYADAVHAYIRSNVEFLHDHPRDIAALTEVLANARATPGVDQIFRTSHEDAIAALAALLDAGIAAGEFVAIPARTAAISLRAAIDAASTGIRLDHDFDVVAFGADLAELWDRTLGL
ncbi:TetR/AcrR family transcriptional regulator [Rudaeicoccus suwonensis]|uniref:TetR family transcriptional regulator n=1 Tax=Rudaeicoccus suwonensis TaxID=657409 RepID=A0A561E8F8_9MICO|nr:TetR/AcrR family transcriptional regulator [Rudaeicoccus suwonensis]TWE11894.1 TetR family transcriptional regulator [Rudaeicoccus suwonensis]